MKIKVGVFFGGKSVEHEVSIITALQAMENFNKDKYDIIPIYITKENKMYCGNYISDIKQYCNIENLLHISSQVTLAKEKNKIVLLKCNKKFYENKIYDYIDIAFPIVHGTNTEDGTLQGYLKMFDIPFVCSDVTQSAIGMDKYFSKCILKENNIPVIDCKYFSKKDYLDNVESIFKICQRDIKYPMIVKPANLGSSVGIKIAYNKCDFEEALENAFSYSNKIIVEKAIINLKEINCSVIGDYESTKVSECEQPIKTEDILSFEDKYVLGNKHSIKNNNINIKNIDLDEKTKQNIQNLAIRTFKVLDLNGIARIDFIIDKNTNEIFVNEVNTIPGCLSYHLWKQSNISYTELIDELINIALKRNREEKNLCYFFDNNLLNEYSLNGCKINK